MAAGIVRYDDHHPDGRAQDPPRSLAAHDALVRNPHIQGSDLFDDDKRLIPLVADGGRLARRGNEFVGTILRLHASGADVILGIDTGAAALPAAATLRTQLVDLDANSPRSIGAPTSRSAG